MTVARATRKFVDSFDRPIDFTAGTANGPWGLKDTSSAGAPTYASEADDGGGFKITLANTNEAETVTLYHEDKLFYDLRKLQHLWWIIKVGSIDALCVLTAGVGAAQADDEDEVVTNAWFKMEGATSTTALVVETDDATNDTDDTATTKTLAAVYKKLHIDFTMGVDDVRFYIDGDRVATSTTFDMSDLTAGLNVQPYLQLSKPSGTGTPSVTIAEFGIQYEYAYGA